MGKLHVFILFFLMITLADCVVAENCQGYDAVPVVPGKYPEGLLIDNGVALATIVVPKDASFAEDYAAKDLQKVLYKMTGVALPIANDCNELNGNRILIGSTQQTDSVVSPTERANLGKEDYLARLSGRDIVLVGGGYYGTIYACAEIYELLGARWYMSGELGECIPKLDTVRINNLDVRRSPSFKMRWIGGNLNWSMRNRLNCVQNNPEMPPAFTIKPVQQIWDDGYIGLFHTQQDLLPDEQYFANHPEYYALVDGKRSTNINLRKLCNSNPAVAIEVAKNLAKLVRENPNIDLLNFSPTDGWEHCECEQCRKLDEPNVPQDRRYSRRQMILYNRVAEELEKQFPDQKILIGAYHIYAWPPKDTSVKAHKNLAVVICHYEDYCLAHPTNDPSCPPNKRYLELIRQWQKHTSNIFLYEYYAKGNWRGLPWPIVHTIEKDIPFYHSINIAGLYTQWDFSGLIWGNFLDGYVAAKLLWDHTADVQEILDEFYKKFYGRAAVPMRRWHETLEKQLANCGVHMPGNAPRNAHYIFTEKVMKNLKQCIKKAVSLANDDIVKRRLERMAALTEYTDKLANVFRLRKQAVKLEGQEKIKALEKAIHIFEELQRDVDKNPGHYEGISSHITMHTRSMQRMVDQMKKYLVGKQLEQKKDSLLADEEID
jgi:cell fate (sporulation/competence/biofilm development) regulator YmcA (YheA/YmcA/DUF963 family)